MCGVPREHGKGIIPLGKGFAMSMLTANLVGKLASSKWGFTEIVMSLLMAKVCQEPNLSCRQRKGGRRVRDGDGGSDRWDPPYSFAVSL
jgi:hypothetical protein